MPPAGGALARRLVVILAGTAGMMVLGAARAEDVPLPPKKPVSSPATSAVAAPPDRGDKPAGDTAATSGCAAGLAALGIRTIPVDLPPDARGDCAIAEPVRLAAVTTPAGAIVELPGRPLLSCPFARSFASFAVDLVAPLAGAAGKAGAAAGDAGLVAIETGPGFECRRRNRAATGKISAHARGTAVDIAAFVMADGTRWIVGGAAAAPGTRTIATIRTAACGWFTTVLGPGSDASHTDHLHLDSEPHGRSARYRICD